MHNELTLGQRVRIVSIASDYDGAEGVIVGIVVEPMQTEMYLVRFKTGGKPSRVLAFPATDVQMLAG